jgi:hypothetical protein
MRHTPLLALLLAAALAAAAPVLGQSVFDSLPEGMDPYASRRSACFLPGELDGLDAQIDATRQPLPGCAAGMVPPQSEIDASRSYKRRSGSIVDCASMRRREAGNRYLKVFIDDVLTASRDAPACAAGMLRNWAEADAMAEIGTEEAVNTSRALGMFTLAGLSSTYLVAPDVRAAAGPEGDREILAWFRRLSARVEEDIVAKRAREDEDNIQYWQGFAVLPTALMTADPALLKQSRATFHAAMREVTEKQPNARDDGFLPLELERGDKALNYQFYALHPIIGMATLSQAYGCDFLDTDWKRDQFVSLMSRTLEGNLDPQMFAEAAVRFGKRKKPVKQQRSYKTRHASGLMYLVDRMDPDLFDRIDARVAEETGRPRPVFVASKGAEGAHGRIGGSYARLADRAEELAGEPAPGPLAEVCDGR